MPGRDRWKTSLTRIFDLIASQECLGVIFARNSTTKVNSTDELSVPLNISEGLC